MYINKFAFPVILSLGMLVALSVSSAEAQISKIGGTAGLSVLVAPTDVRPGKHQSNTAVFVFSEKQNVSVTGLTTDMGGPITGNVNSYMLYSDQVNTTGDTTYDITVSSSNPILGVIRTSSRLDSTDGTLGLSTTTYPFGDGSRGQEPNDTTSFTNYTLTIHNVTGSNVDEIRVLTAATPEPGSIALLVGMGISGAGFLARRRRRANIAA